MTEVLSVEWAGVWAVGYQWDYTEVLNVEGAGV